MILKETYTLSNGADIPKLGLGTWFISDEDITEAVKEAAKIGYRHIDSAQAYQNENGVGEGIKASGVNREDLFVTTKLAAEVKSYGEAVASIDESLERMGLDYINLMIIHSPQPWAEFGGEDRYKEGNVEAWKALDEAGKLRAIGHGELFKNEEIAEMADKYDVSVPQLCIRYCLQLGLLPIPKTANPSHMKDNAGVDFEISEEDMKSLKNMDPIEDYGEAGQFPVYAEN